ncbi:MAG: hypothetical protein ACI9B9_002553 [Halioglobus sp.]|jgi:hypothetical protein
MTDSIADRYKSRIDSFMSMRLIAAVLVLVGHNFELSSPSTPDPLHHLVGYGMAKVAVDLFFIMSGFMVAGSLLQQNNLPSFAVNRVLRIIPGLTVAVIFCTFIIGISYTTLTLQDYLNDETVWQFLFGKSTVLGVVVTGGGSSLPGVFESNPIPSTDNGSQTNTYPDGGAEPFRGEKGSTWEGGFRVPALIRWPGVVKEGTVINDIFSHQDWLPTFLAAAGEPNIATKLKKGHRAGDATYKVHLDGFDQTDLLAGKGPGKRENIYYFDDNANFNAFRWNDWKIHFGFQMEGWGGPREALNFPRVINLRTDPYETSIDSSLYSRFFADQLWLFVPTQREVGKWLATFREFPPRQATASFTIDRVMQQMQQMMQMKAPAAARGAAAGQ